MLLKKVTLAAVAGTALLAAAPAFADGYRGDRNELRGNHFQRGGHYASYQAPRYYGQRPVFVHRPVVVRRPVVVQPQPVVVYHEHGAHDVLGGLIVGAVLGAVIANHAGY